MIDHDNSVAMAVATERSFTHNCFSYSAELLPTMSTSLMTFLSDIRTLVRNLSKAYPVKFKFVWDEQRYEFVVDSTPLGYEFFRLASGPFFELKTACPSHAFDPEIQIFLDAVVRRDLNVKLRSRPSQFEQWNDIYLRAQSALRAVQGASKRESFHERIQKHREAMDERFQATLAYFNKLHATFPHATIHQAEFFYSPDQPLGNSSSSEMHEVVQAHGKDLFRRTRKVFGDKLFGQAWQLDYNSDGYRYFLALVLDCDAITELDQLMHQWQADITHGVGRAVCDPVLSANTYRMQYRGSCGGHKCRTSTAEQIRNTVMFMTRGDEIVRFAPAGSAATFGLETFPRERKPTAVCSNNEKRHCVS